MIDTKIKIEIAKEVITKLGQTSNKVVIDCIAESMLDNRFVFELQDNEVVAFVCWEKIKIIDNKKFVFIRDLFIDPRYKNKGYVIKIRTVLRNLLKCDKYVWVNRKTQKLIERV